MQPALINTAIDKIIPAFGWMLIHSLWEGLLFAIITGAVLMLSKKAKAAYRYNLVLVLFITLIITCSATFIYEWNAAAMVKLNAGLRGGDGRIIPALLFSNMHSIKLFIQTLTGYFSANEPLIVLIWFVCFLFKSVKMLACLVYNQQIRNRQVVEPPVLWAQTVAAFAEKLQIKRAVKLLQSGYIKMPVVVGHLKPLILIPVGLLARLPEDQVEAILLHELAHIRRNDYFVNFLQNIAETIFFFNPGLLWMSALLREERENCCDDIALEQTQNKISFVQALISFKEHELYGSAYAVAFPGRKNYLLRRVSRIMSNKNMTFGPGEKIFFTASILILSVLMTMASVAQIKEYKHAKFMRTYVGVIPVIKPETINGAITKDPRAAKALTHAGIKMIRRMSIGIASIKSEPLKVAGTATPAVPPVIQLNNRQELVGNVQPNIQVDAGGQQVTNDQARAEADQLRALKDQQDALRGQAQTKIDQAQALKDQAQARLEQLKNEPVISSSNQAGESKSREQAQRDKEQVLLNLIQQKKNEEQALRNQEQARLNRIQERKNQEQAILNQEQAARNQQQARLNQRQAKKNQEQATKNKASIQE